MNKKKILLFIGIFLLTGCTATANIKVNYDYTVKESVDIIFDNNLSINYDSPTEYAENYLNYYSSAINLKSYSYEIKEKSDFSSVKFSKTSKNICENVKNSLFAQYLYTNINCTEDEEYFIISSNGKQLVSLPQSEKKFNIESIILKISLPVLAEEDNADFSDNNVYTWEYDETSDSNKSIYLKVNKKTLEKNKEDVENKKKNAVIVNKVLIILGVLAFIATLGIVAIYFYKKYKNNRLEY